MISKVLAAGALVLALALSGCGEGHTVLPGQEEQGGAAMETAFTVDTPIQTVMDDPMFDDYGRLLFPVDTGYWSGETLGDLRLSYYSHIDPDETVEIVNTLKERALAGQTIFYDIYTGEEKAADPGLEQSSCSTQGWASIPPATRPPMPVWEIRMGSPAGAS